LNNPDRPREDPTVAIAAETPAEKKDKRPNSAHLKVMPETRDLRDRVRAEAARFAAGIDRSQALTKPDLRRYGETLLAAMGLTER